MSLCAVTDAFLAVRAAAGDEAAFAELARRYRPLICSVTQRPPLGAEIEDLRQEALIGLFEACRAHDPAKGRFAGLGKSERALAGPGRAQDGAGRQAPPPQRGCARWRRSGAPARRANGGAGGRRPRTGRRAARPLARAQRAGPPAAAGTGRRSATPLQRRADRPCARADRPGPDAQGGRVGDRGAHRPRRAMGQARRPAAPRGTQALHTGRDSRSGRARAARGVAAPGGQRGRSFQVHRAALAAPGRMTDSPQPLLGSRSCTHTSFLVRVELTALGQQLGPPGAGRRGDRDHLSPRRADGRLERDLAHTGLSGAAPEGAPCVEADAMSRGCECREGVREDGRWPSLEDVKRVLTAGEASSVWRSSCGRRALASSALVPPAKLSGRCRRGGPPARGWQRAAL
jgi:hypothetical protein